LEPPGGYLKARPPISTQGLYAHPTAHFDSFQVNRLKNPSDKIESNEPLQTLSSTKPCHDDTLEACVCREVEEETGLILKVGQLQQVSTSTYNGFYNELPSQHSNTRYLVVIKDNKLPSLKPGDDLKYLEWVNLNQIQKTEGPKNTYEFTYGNTKISNVYAPIIEEALAFWRNKEVQEYGLTRNMVMNLLGEESPSSELDNTSVGFHQKIIEQANNIREKLKATHDNIRL